MNEKYHAVEEGFYTRCAELLGVPHTYQPWVGRGPNRWNNRNGGNGRYSGFGTIRMYGPQLIHVNMRHPRLISKSCRSVEEVYALLEALRPSAA